MDALADSLSKQTIAICEQVTTAAKSFQVPDTGRLRASIMWKEVSGKSGGLEGGSRLQTEPKKGGVVGSGVDYAVYEEFGTRSRAPKPFLRPAAEAVRKGNWKEVIKKIEQENAKGPLTDKKRVKFV